MSSLNSNTNNTSSYSSATGGTTGTGTGTTPSSSSFSHNIASSTTTAGPSSNSTTGTTTPYRPFEGSGNSVYPGRQSRFTEHFEYSEWKNMLSVVDHSKHFELMQVPIEHERREAESKEKGKRKW